MRGKYLSPKADLTFKLVFGEHKDLMMSLLNALLPLPDDAPITELEYSTPEMTPEYSGKKNSVVDVRCTDARGRHFLVEMQMNWNEEFKKRVIMNVSKAVMKQVGTGEMFARIAPVFSLNLLNEEGFDRESDSDEFYHDYAILNVAHPERSIDYLRFVFVELPKFKPRNVMEKGGTQDFRVSWVGNHMAVLWLRFLTEINEDTTEVPAELKENPEISKALAIVEKSAMTEAQLYAYERFWDALNREDVLVRSSFKEGEAKGRAEVARKMKQSGLPSETIADFTGLSLDEINKL